MPPPAKRVGLMVVTETSSHAPGAISPCAGSSPALVSVPAHRLRQGRPREKGAQHGPAPAARLPRGALGV